MTAPKMPDEYKGTVNKSGGYTTTNPREWTPLEIEWVKSLKKQGYTNKEIAESVDRTVTSVSIKIKRLNKNQNNYNQEHYEEKYESNSEFLRLIKPLSVLDLYCGEKSYYSQIVKDIVTNDKNEGIKADFHEDALSCICYLYSCGDKFDLIHLDPFGSAYDCFDLAIKMARKGLIITFGEMGHKRWKRLDYVSRYYDINSLDDFTIDNLIHHVQMIGRRNKKILTPVIVKNWRNISRVYFTIDTLKITEQWESVV